MLLETAGSSLSGLLGGLIGASLGSFTHAAGLRLSQQEDPVSPRSQCRQCQRQLTLIELIPIISWVIQCGKCLCKKQSLNPLYVIFEVAFTLLVGHAWYTLPMTSAIGLTIFYVLLGICFVTDFYQEKLHLPTMLAMIALGLIFQITQGGTAFLFNSTLASLFGFLLIFLTNLLYKIFRKQDGFGNGDSWLLAGIGAWMSPIDVLVIFVLAAWIGAGYGIASIFLKKSTLKTALPFGVFLTIASLLVIHSPFRTH